MDVLEELKIKSNNCTIPGWASRAGKEIERLRQSEREGWRYADELQAQLDNCATCANRGLVDGLSQEMHCEQTGSPLADRLDAHGLQYGERLYYEAATELRRLTAALEKYEADDVRYLAETRRLREALATESSRKCASEHDCVWQPHCAHSGKCLRPERPSPDAGPLQCGVSPQKG